MDEEGGGDQGARIRDEQFFLWGEGKRTEGVVVGGVLLVGVCVCECGCGCGGWVFVAWGSGGGVCVGGWVCGFVFPFLAPEGDAGEKAAVEGIT